MDLVGIHTSWVVPPLLAAFYVVLGSLFVISDNLLSASDEKGTSSTLIPISTLSASEKDGVATSRQIGIALAAWGVLAADLQLSATLYHVSVGSV